jgi:squalene-associated FAD-dependent desaturase
MNQVGDHQVGDRDPQARHSDRNPQASHRNRILVIGGGLAGITAALDCEAAGAEVTLLESRGRLGGQAYSFDRNGFIADNGQHVFLRCCTAYQELVARLGATGLVTLQPRLDITVLGVDGEEVTRGRLHRSGLPAPLHLARSLLQYPFLSMRRRLSVAVAMQALKSVDVDDPANDQVTFGAWLRAHRQGRREIESMWDLITRATVNLSCDEASLAQAAYVFQEGILSSASAGDIGHATAPLSEIHDVAARAALQRAGVDVRLRTGAAAIVPGKRGGFTVTCSGQEQLVCDGLILAVGPARMAALAPEGSGVDPASLLALGESPIVNVHVVFDRPVLDVPFAAGAGTPVQWIFDRTASAGVTDGQYLVVTLSAAIPELGMSGELIIERYLGALRELLPAAREASVQRAFVTRDHAATFRAAPGQRALRPAAATALPALALAGAHTDTGWPATMEGAVRSGHAAADVVLGALASDTDMLEPALSRSAA